MPIFVFLEEVKIKCVCVGGGLLAGLSEDGTSEKRLMLYDLISCLGKKLFFQSQHFQALQQECHRGSRKTHHIFPSSVLLVLSFSPLYVAGRKKLV